jgi:hypothetical protein
MVDRTAAPEQALDALVAGDVGRHRDRIQLVCRGGKAFRIPGSDDDLGAFALGHFGGGETNARRAADDHDFLAFKQHAVSLSNHAG